MEYNNFFLRAVKSIFRSSANAGMWQYLASVPYDTIKEEIIWHAYALYHFSDELHLVQLRAERDFCVKVKNELIQSATSFEDTLSGLPDTEVMFLLTTFASKIANTIQYSLYKFFWHYFSFKIWPLRETLSHLKCSFPLWFPNLSELVF